MFDDTSWRTSEQTDGVWQGATDLQGTIIGAMLGVVVLASPVELPLVFSALLAIPLFTFLPGYAVLAALFPAGTDPENRGPQMCERYGGSLPTIDRLALSIAVSLAIVPLVAVAGNGVWGIALEPVLIVVGVLTLGAALVAIYRRSKLPPERRFVPLSSVRPIRRSLPHTTSGQFLVAALLLGGLVAGASIAYGASSPDDASTTEFYLVNETDDGLAVTSEPGGDQRVAIEHEGSETFTVVVTETIAGTESEIHRKQVTVENNKTVVSVPSGSFAATRVDYMLYRGDPPENPQPDNAMRTLTVTANDTTTD